MMGNMIERVVEAREAKEAIDIGRLVFGTSVQLLSNTIFSIDILHPNSNEMKELHLLNANIMLLVGKPNLGDYFPFLKPFDLQGIRREIKVSYDRLHELVDDMIDRHMKNRSLGLDHRHGDLLDVLLDFTEMEGAEGLTRMDVKLLIVDFFIAGTEPITTTVEWAMAELLQNPTIYSKTKQELEHKIPLGRTVQEQDLPRLPYLMAVIKETMRLHMTAPFLLPHRAEQDVEICGYTIPKNTRVLVNAWSISKDPLYWDAPTIFKPERFMNSDITDFRSKDLSFMPFGAGRRICAGMNLAVRMESLIFATLVQKFDWKLPNGIAMGEKFGITLKKAEPLIAMPV
ncbi:hypothetical protein RD792_017489 [Penstemon davidsonii]|uniref:Cytochrome P450 n=1 Tax=Penstemon davidsonii TaxID=160366 RepID=A0ABR0CNZ2_9LAMI|nr:hypothetical protein RD792_017489 [Penstemon davidsonii]